MAQSLMLPRMSGAAKCGELARLEEKKLPMHAATIKCSGVDDAIDMHYHVHVRVQQGISWYLLSVQHTYTPREMSYFSAVIEPNWPRYNR